MKGCGVISPAGKGIYIFRVCTNYLFGLAEQLANLDSPRKANVRGCLGAWLLYSIAQKWPLGVRKVPFCSYITQNSDCEVIFLTGDAAVICC